MRGRDDPSVTSGGATSNVLDLSRWFTLKLPDLSKEAFAFAVSQVTSRCGGVFSTQNLIVDSDDLRMTGGGKIDLANDEIGLSWPCVRFAGIDTAINYIPCSVEVSRPSKFFWSPASISRVPSKIPPSPAPLSTMSEWGFRRSWNSEKYYRVGRR